MLKTAREDKELTTIFVALRVGITPSFLILIEKGDKFPTPDYFADLCKLLDVDLAKAWKLLHDERMKFYEQRLNREFNHICGAFREK